MPVIEILVKAGDTVEAEQPLVTLESDKATMDVPSPAAGKITEIIAKVGDKVSMGALIAKLDAGGPAAPVRPSQENEAQAKEEEDAARAPDTPPVAPRDLPPALSAGAGPAKADFSGVFAGPAVRRLARELDLDLNRIKGTGEKGRITREDVKAALSRGGAGGAPAAAAPCRRFPRSISPSSGRSRPCRCRASSASPGRACTRPGSTFRMSRIPTRPTSPTSTPSARALDEDAKKDKTKPYRVSLLPLLHARHGRDAEGVPDFQRRVKSQPATR